MGISLYGYYLAFCNCDLTNLIKPFNVIFASSIKINLLSNFPYLCN